MKVSVAACAGDSAGPLPPLVWKLAPDRESSPGRFLVASAESRPKSRGGDPRSFTLPFDSFRKLQPLLLQLFVLLFDPTRDVACELPAFFRMGAEFVASRMHKESPSIIFRHNRRVGPRHDVTAVTIMRVRPEFLAPHCGMQNSPPRLPGYTLPSPITVGDSWP
jgi:hypothetical protein